LEGIGKNTHIQKIGSLNDSPQNMLKEFESKIEAIYKTNTAHINKETADTVKSVKNFKTTLKNGLRAITIERK